MNLTVTQYRGRSVLLFTNVIKCRNQCGVNNQKQKQRV